MAISRLSDDAFALERSLLAEQRGALAGQQLSVAECLGSLREAADTVWGPLLELSDALVLQDAMVDRHDLAAVRLMVHSNSKSVLIAVDAGRQLAGIAAGECANNPLVQSSYGQVVNLFAKSSVAVAPYAPRDAK
jgi:hypothetical protein